MALFFFVSLACADTGLISIISIKSSHDVKKTGDRLESVAIDLPQKPMLVNNQVMIRNMMTHKNRLIIQPIMIPLKKNVESL
jgi:hypothetical protein